MKIELISFAALAASATAIPTRFYTLTGPVPHLAPSEVQAGHPYPHPHHGGGAGEMKAPHLPHGIFAPCHGHGHGQGGTGASPFSDLFSRLGFGPAPARDHIAIVSAVHQHHPEQDHIPGHAHGHGHGQGRLPNGIIAAWKAYVEQTFGRPAREIVPIIQGGEVRIMPFTEGDKTRMEQAGGREHYAHPHAHAQAHGHEHEVGPEVGNDGTRGGRYLRPHGGHHWRHKASSFGGRLHRAMLHLSPLESIALAFVLGAGIGSILHMIFMLLLISIRGFRSRSSSRAERGTKEERRQARRERRQARRQEEEARLAFPADLKEVEVLPSYKDGEGDRLVEKA